MRRAAKSIKSVPIIRKKAKTALPKKQPNLEKFYTPSAPFRETGIRGGFEILLQPSHGVSGFETTGTPGSFDIQNRRAPPSFASTQNIDPTTSSFALQDRGSSMDIEAGANRFVTPSVSSIANYDDPTYTINANFMTPTIEEIMEEGRITSASTMSEILQASGDPIQDTYVRRRLFEGYGQDDPIVQHMIRDEETPSSVSASAHHHPNTEYVNGTHTSRPYSTPRSNAYGENGTENQVYQIITSGNVVTPSGQSDLPDINNQSTPAVPNDSNAATGTHPQEGGMIAPSSGTSAGSGTPQIAGTIVPINTTPYLGLGLPPQPQVMVQEGTGELKDITSRGIPYQSQRSQINFML